VESSLYPSTRSSSTTCAEYAFQCESVFFLFTSERTASVPSYFPCYRIVSDSSSPCPQGKWVGYYIAAGSTSRIVAPLLFAYFFQYFGPKYTHTLYTPSSSILCSFLLSVSLSTASFGCRRPAFWRSVLCCASQLTVISVPPNLLPFLPLARTG
jgi:hypothetical protein